MKNVEENAPQEKSSTGETTASQPFPMLDLSKLERVRETYRGLEVHSEGHLVFFSDVQDLLAAAQPSPRLISDAECAQGKCACTTSGCWGECSLKRFGNSAATVVVAGQPSPARSGDGAAGGFYLSYESIPEAHRKAEGRIVKMVSEAERVPSGESVDTAEFRDLFHAAAYSHACFPETFQNSRAWGTLIDHIDARRATAGNAAPQNK